MSNCLPAVSEFDWSQGWQQQPLRHSELSQTRAARGWGWGAQHVGLTPAKVKGKGGFMPAGQRAGPGLMEYEKIAPRYVTSGPH